MAVVTICAGTPKETSYHIDDRLKMKWDKIRGGKLAKEDDDKVFIVDGRERSGKSVFAFQQACYIDETLVGDLSRVCFTAEEFLSAIRNTNSDKEKTKCIIFDEAFRGLASRAAMSKVNKKIIQSLMEVGQKNLVLFIVLPSFFMLDLYPAMLRSDALFHIKKDKKTKLRSFSVYSRAKKGKLYQVGVRKGWTYAIKTGFNGRFPKTFPGGDKFDKLYRKKKFEVLVESENDIKYTDKERNWIKQRDILINYFIKRDKLSMRKAVDFFKSLGIDLKLTQIHEIKKKMVENTLKPVEKAKIEMETDGIESESDDFDEE